MWEGGVALGGQREERHGLASERGRTSWTGSQGPRAGEGSGLLVLYFWNVFRGEVQAWGWFARGGWEVEVFCLLISDSEGLGVSAKSKTLEKRTTPEPHTDLLALRG